MQSPTATKLPVKLALALLKNRQGDIDLDLPVTGDLDDPEFSIGGVVVKMFVNLIVGIVSSPFQVLGALVGGGEELGHPDRQPEAGEPRNDGWMAGGGESRFAAHRGPVPARHPGRRPDSQSNEPN